MRRRTAVQMLGTLALLGPTAGTSLFAQGDKKEDKKEAPPAPALKVGDMAPDFTLPDQTYKNKVSLHDFKGKKNVALAFYIFAFTGGWTKQMQNFQANLQKLEAADTQVLGVSMDSPFSNAAWAEKINVTFPLLSDWGGDVTRKYGLYDEKHKIGRRVNFLIDKEGKIAEMQVDSDAVDPAAIVTSCERRKLKS